MFHLQNSKKNFICKIPRNVSSAKYQEKDAPETQSLPGLEIFIFEWLMVGWGEWMRATAGGMNPFLKAGKPFTKMASKQIITFTSSSKFIPLAEWDWQIIEAAPLIYQNETASRVTVQLWSTTKVAIRLLVRGSVTNVRDLPLISPRSKRHFLGSAAVDLKLHSSAAHNIFFSVPASAPHFCFWIPSRLDPGTFGTSDNSGTPGKPGTPGNTFWRSWWAWK